MFRETRWLHGSRRGRACPGYQRPGGTGEDVRPSMGNSKTWTYTPATSDDDEMRFVYQVAVLVILIVA